MLFFGMPKKENWDIPMELAEITHTWPEDEIHSKTQMSRFRHLQTNMSAWSVWNSELVLCLGTYLFSFYAARKSEHFLINFNKCHFSPIVIFFSFDATKNKLAEVFMYYLSLRSSKRGFFALTWQNAQHKNTLCQVPINSSLHFKGRQVHLHLFWSIFIFADI